MKEFFYKNKTRLILVSILLMAFLIAGIFALNEYLAFSPFQMSYEYTGVSLVSPGSDGCSYVIDDGGESIIILDEKGRLIHKIDGGSTSAPFYFATHVCDDGNGTIYVSDVRYGEHGNLVDEERILSFTDGKWTVEKSFTFENQEKPKLQYGAILEMTSFEGEISALFYNEDQLSVFSKPLGGTFTQSNTISIPDRLNCAGYDPETQSVAYATRKGQIFWGNLSDSKQVEIADENTSRIVKSIVIADGMISYTDTMNEEVGKAEIPSDGNDCSFKIYKDLGHTFRNLTVGDAEGELYMTSDNIYFTADADMNITSHESAPLGCHTKLTLVWIFGVMLLALLLLYLYAFARHLYQSYKVSEMKHTINRLLMVIVSTSAVALIISTTSITDMMESKTDTMMTDIQTFADILAVNIPGHKLSEITSPKDYGSETFTKIKTALDRVVNVAYENGNYYYYVVHYADEESGLFRGVMDYEDSFSPGAITGVIDMEDEFGAVYLTGEPIRETGSVDTYGSWMYSVVPIKASDGRIVGVLDVGRSLSPIRKEIDDFWFASICSIFCASIVMTMLVLESIFLLEYYERRKNPVFKHQYEGINAPVRYLIALLYMANGMQSVFVVILCEKYYNAAEGLIRMIPAGIAIALPLSVHFFASAASSLTGGSLAERFGTKKILSLGFITACAGFAICGLAQGYYLLLVGKLLAGIGEGFIYVSENTIAALGKNDGAQARAYSDISAGISGGNIIGLGIGAVLLNFSSTRTVFITGAVLLFIGLMICQNMEDERGTVKKDERSIRTIQFLADRRVWSFLILILFPYMIYGAYQEYVFPLAVTEYGITETQIGQIRMTCGLVFIYLGPYITRTLIKKIGAKFTAAAASVVFAIAMVAAVSVDSAFCLIAGMALISFANSFGFASQYVHFGELPPAVAYGEGNSMGVYSTVECMGQTLGPVIFGIAMAAGMKQGIFMIAAVVLVATVLFLLINQKRLGVKNEQ